MNPSLLASALRGALLTGTLLSGATLGAISLPQDPPQAQGSGIPECTAEVKTTASGLKYCVLREGTGGPPPTADDTVEVHYTGWLTDGTKFDSSRDRGQSTRFGVRQVIPGWTEGLQLMREGARFKLEIPGELGYGERGAPPKIPANATLIFDVELLRVVRMPVLPQANPDKQQKAPGGVTYEVLTPGTGAMVGETNGLALRYAIWRAGGELLDCTEKRDGQKIGGTLDSLPAPFLKELFAGAKVGEKVRAEVPQSVFPNYGSDTVWVLELVTVSQLPAFRLPDQDKVVTTQSGLRYEVLEPGEGTSPTARSTVVAHYTGWLTDGTVFDSSHARGEPSSFGLAQVIPGWTEGLQLMKPGGKFLFEIPAELGYGARARGKIPANATLVFFVELVEVK